MQKLIKGEYFGEHTRALNFNNFLVTDTEYTHDRVDWHYHENPYLTFLLYGKLFEANKKESYYLEPGSLLFHNWQDAHYNIKPPEYTRGFHIELTTNWFDTYQITLPDIEGSTAIDNPLAKQQICKIVFETKMHDPFTSTSVELLLLNAFSQIKNDIDFKNDKPPKWVHQLKAIMHEEAGICLSLSNLSSHLNIHPVHISRQFPKYFNTSLGNYIRTLRINKAIFLMTHKDISMTEIAYACDFCDQSHFINSFKNIYGITPLTYRKKSHMLI